MENQWGVASAQGEKRVAKEENPSVDAEGKSIRTIILPTRHSTLVTLSLLTDH